MLKVNEIFGPTIQGEGRSAGKEVMFLRLATCNLHCQWCDTPYTWNWVGTKWEHPDKFNPADEVHLMEDIAVWKSLHTPKQNHDLITALVISGGEPLIQQKQLGQLLVWLRLAGWWVEIETNGTIAPLDFIYAHVDQFNVSPKLSNSGDPAKLRIREPAMEYFGKCDKAYFKFVISDEQDVPEVMEYITRFGLDPDRVYLMPLGKTQLELMLTTDITKALCEQHGFHFSDRLHVRMFGARRAV